MGVVATEKEEVFDRMKQRNLKKKMIKREKRIKRQKERDVYRKEHE